MRDERKAARGRLLDRAARIAFAFLVLNVAAVAGVAAALTGRRVWR
jgi:hypothetical protein